MVLVLARERLGRRLRLCGPRTGLSAATLGASSARSDGGPWAGLTRPCHRLSRTDGAGVIRGAGSIHTLDQGRRHGAKQGLLQQAEQEYDGLKVAIKGLDDAQMGQVWLGTWGVRDILAHMTGWHREMIPALERLAGTKWRIQTAPTMTKTAGTLASWRPARNCTGRPPARAWITPGSPVVRAASRLPDEHFAEGKTAPGLFDGVAGGHYREHAEQIRQWRQR